MEKCQNEQAKDGGQEKALDDFQLPKLQNSVKKVFMGHFKTRKKNKVVLPITETPVPRNCAWLSCSAVNTGI